MSPEDFARQCRIIAATFVGHARHRAFDALCEEALRSAGYGEGVAIFEASVAHWHDVDHDYPHRGPCPDCERERGQGDVR